MNLFSMIILIYIPIHWVIIYFLLFFFTLFPCTIMASEYAKKISAQIKYEHSCIYEKYKSKNPNMYRTHQGKEIFYLLRPGLIKDKDAFSQLNKEQKKLFKRYVNNFYGIFLSFILIISNLIISSIYFIY